MKHFITGGSGFFGQHLINRLLKAGDSVIVYDLSPLDEEFRLKGVEFVHGDVRDREKVREAMKGADVVHHNAAALPIARAGKTYESINVHGLHNVLEAARDLGVKKVLAVSTSAVYGIPKTLPINEDTPLTPLGDYGWSKFRAEQLVRKFRASNDLDVSIVRPRTIVGTGRLGIFGILFDWIARGKRVYIIGRGDNMFQLLSAPDLAEACYLMTQKPCWNEDFNIGATEYGTVAGDLEKLIQYAGTKAKVQPTSAFLVRNILRILDILRLSPLVDWHYKTPHKPFYFDVSKAQKILGWQPKDSNEAMFRETYDWYMRNRNKADSTTGTTHRKTVKQGALKWVRDIS